jgi:hypothetical protein
MKAAGYIKNCTPTRALKDRTPYKAWHGKQPDLAHLCELGCKAWVLNMNENLKIYKQSIECLLIGYSENSKAYRCWDQANRRIHVNWNVTFAKSQDLQECPLHPGMVLGDGRWM